MSIFKVIYKRNVSVISEVAIIETESFEQAKNILIEKKKYILNGVTFIPDIKIIEQTDWELFI